MSTYTISNLSGHDITCHDFRLLRNQSKIVVSITPNMLTSLSKGQISITPSIATNQVISNIIDSTTGTASGSNTLVAASAANFTNYNNNFATLALMLLELINAINRLNSVVYNTAS
jgi:hypothetical protein